MVMERVGKSDALTKIVFHRRLRKWANTTSEQQIGPGKVPYIYIRDGATYYRIHSDSQRFAVENYLKLVAQFGDSIQWSVDWSSKKKFTLIKVGPEKKHIKSLLLYLAPNKNNLGQSTTLRSEDSVESFSAEELSPEQREVIYQQIRRRRGQRKFRDALRKLYRNTCVVTGCKIVDLLEAAHIRTMPGIDDNNPENGLLLRADIHTLFDLNLLGIDPKSLKVHLHSSIKSSEYARYDGQSLLDHKGKPLIESRSRPSVESLADRFHAFRT